MRSPPALCAFDAHPSSGLSRSTSRGARERRRPVAPGTAAVPGRSPVARPSTEDSASAPARSGYRDSATARVRKVEGKNQYRVLQEAIGSDGRRWFRSGHDQVVDPDSGGDCDRLPRRLGLPTRTDSTC